MCELFGVTSSEKIPVQQLLETFFSHAAKHPDGWGLASFFEDEIALNKQSMNALRSRFLQAQLSLYKEADKMIAHIRRATKGQVEYENTHPFTAKDNTGRNWTLAHNGTIFESSVVDEMFYQQKGTTDSERLLLYIIKRMNMRYPESKNAACRFNVLQDVLREITTENKVNLLLYDGEIMYVHSNYRNSLFIKQQGPAAIFATVPLDEGDWKPVPLNTLLGYTDGRLPFTGVPHNNEFFDSPEKYKHLFLDYSAL